MENLRERFQDAVRQFWTGREHAQAKQIEGGRIDAGTRGSVTAGTHMGALEVLVVDLLEDAGLKKLDIKTRTGVELPGYYRPEKRWDLLVVSEDHLVVAIEFKSQVGPSFGNNYYELRVNSRRILEKTRMEVPLCLAAWPLPRTCGDRMSATHATSDAYPDFILRIIEQRLIKFL